MLWNFAFCVEQVLKTKWIVKNLQIRLTMTVPVRLACFFLSFVHVKSGGSHLTIENDPSLIKQISDRSAASTWMKRFGFHLLSKKFTKKKNEKHTKFDLYLIFSACLCWLLWLKFDLCTHAINIPKTKKERLYLSFSSLFDYIEILYGIN